ncbi:MAG TPA: tetratricopeptide repeat protein [Tepidisphaeraceae bacterium]|jgi:tetratricopeptide (TPR) repeat protein
MADEAAYHQTSEANKKKAEAFFKQGRTVAQAGQYEYAIEMFLQGLARDPEAVTAHQALRDISLKRKASGGKDMGMMTKMKNRYGKDDIENMVVAERFLSYDPGNTGRMLELLNHATDAGCRETVMWIGPILLRANIDSGKPEIGKFLALKDCYMRVGNWQHAVDAAQHALRMRPQDMDLATEVKHLAAQQTMQAGGYGQGGNFRDNIRNADQQRQLMDQDKDIRSIDALTAQIIAAREEHKREPNEVGKITKLIDALMKTEQSEYENEAIEVLDSAYQRLGQFRFRFRLGQIKLQQLKRMERSLREELAKNPKDEMAVKTYKEFVKDRAEEEYKEFALAAENYPTDLTLKYEMARRLLQLHKYPEAIPLLQQSVQDAKIRVDGTIELGKAFLAADFLDEAIDTLKGLTESYQGVGDTKAKEIWYWYGRSLEQRGDQVDAIKCFSKVTMWDFNYRDVQARIKALRAKPAANA